MTEPVAPVVPPPISARPAPSARGRRTLPVPPLAPPTGPPRYCGITAIDCNGRLADTAVIPALGWTAGTRLDIRVDAGLVLVTADPHAVFRVTQPGQVRLPAPVRHWSGLTPGSLSDRADPARHRRQHPADRRYGRPFHQLLPAADYVEVDGAAHGLRWTPRGRGQRGAAGHKKFLTALTRDVVLAGLWHGRG